MPKSSKIATCCYCGSRAALVLKRRGDAALELPAFREQRMAERDVGVGPGLPEDHIVDGGFLELVRYGVRAWDAPSIVDSLEELDGDHEDNLRVRYEFDNGHVGWRRYGNDGYGEDGEGATNYHEIDGGNTPGQRGRVWPFFSGVRTYPPVVRLGNKSL